MNKKLANVVVRLALMLSALTFGPQISQLSARNNRVGKSGQKPQVQVVESIDSVEQKASQREAEWSFFIYMQARNNLAPFAGKNLEAIASHKTNSKVNFIVQWDQPKQKGAWRYKIEKNSIALEDYSDVKDPSDQAAKMIEFVRWGAKKFPAKKVCLIFWNHGVGPLNPPYGNPVRMMLSQRNESVSLEPEKYIFLEPHEALPEDGDPETMTKSAMGGKGILFDEDNRTYMTNDDLTKALSKITSKEILGRKIDCLGFDACYMGGLEIAAQVKEYAEYMVASQELELARGWNYDKIAEKVNSNMPSPCQLAKIIVSTYGDMYRGNTNIFTQSAVRLGEIDRMGRDLDQVISAIETAAKEDRAFVLDAIRHARKNCLQFTAKVYVDLHSFYEHLLEHVTERLQATSSLNGLASNNSRQRQQRKSQGQQASSAKASGGGSSSIQVLAHTLQQAIMGLGSCVMENTSSNYLSKAKGLSIYFPLRAVDPSYESSVFAKSTRWLNFIKAFSMR